MLSSEIRTTAASDRTIDRASVRAFVEDIFTTLRRVEQRRWASEYLWALIHAPGKKTPHRLGQAKSLPPAAVRGLHQFINSSPWEWEPVRRRLALRAASGSAPQAVTVAELIVPKSGVHTVGVHHRVDAATGRTLSCQRALGLFLIGEPHCFPLDWRLVLDGAWGWDGQRRRRARVPETETGRPAGAHVLEYAAALARSGLAHLPWVLDLSRCQDSGGVLAGLARLRLDIMCEVDPGQVVLTGRVPTVSGVGALMEMRRARQSHVALAQTEDGSTKAVPVHTYAGTVRLPRLDTRDEADPRTYRVIERPDPDGRLPTRYWLTTLTDGRVEELLALGRGRTRALKTVDTLQRDYGVLDFEGRSFPGWHHHMTMASAAYVYQHLRHGPEGVPVTPHRAPGTVVTATARTTATAGIPAAAELIGLTR
ncbi:IS701 family transposase [Streptomyces sp. JNUCC 64]